MQFFHFLNRKRREVERHGLLESLDVNMKLRHIRGAAHGIGGGWVFWLVVLF